MKLALIAAYARDYAIGVNNGLPWYLPEDLKWFKRNTLGKPIIMGRKTFESIGKPLPMRCNIVITRDGNWSAAGVSVAHSLAEAIERAEQQAVLEGIEEAMVIGGAQIYQDALQYVQRMYLTLVDTQVPKADAFFPRWKMTDWQLRERQFQPSTHHDQPNCEFQILDKLALN